MPSPGVTALETSLSTGTYSVGGFTASLSVTSTIVIALATAMNGGWDSRNTTPTTFQSGIIAALGSYMTGPNSRYIHLIGKGVDVETGSWAASWDSTNNLHHYQPTVASIIAQVQTQYTLNGLVYYPGSQFLTTRVANTFMTYATELAP